MPAGSINKPTAGQSSSNYNDLQEDYFLSPRIMSAQGLAQLMYANSENQYISELVKRARERMKSEVTAINPNMTGPTPAVACVPKNSGEDCESIIKNKLCNILSKAAMPQMDFRSIKPTESIGISENALLPNNSANTAKEVSATTSKIYSTKNNSSPVDESTCSTTLPPQILPICNSQDTQQENSHLNSVSSSDKLTCDTPAQPSEECDIPKQVHQSSRVCKIPKRDSKSQLFLEKIKCSETSNKFFPSKERKKRDLYFRRGEDSADLPFSILTIREQRDFLKRSGESFVQDAPCYEISKMYGVETSGPMFGSESWCKCRECRSAKQKDSLTVFCRFYGFRKLKFMDNQLCTSGFLLPEDCTENDLRLWLPMNRCCSHDKGKEDDLSSPNHLYNDVMSKFILTRIGNQFCEVVEEEKRALSWIKKGGIVYWKRPVSGVREMCDVCETTLFNMHWVCPKCGYGVCLDCYERRMEKSTAEQEVYDSEKSNCFRWLRCAKGKNHFHSSLFPTQIIPSTCLPDLSDMVHEVQELHSIKTTTCVCQKSNLLPALEPMIKTKFFTGPKIAVEIRSVADSSEAESGIKRKRPAESISSSDWIASIESHERKNKERKMEKPKDVLTSGRHSISLSDLIAKRIKSKEAIESQQTVASESQTGQQEMKVKSSSFPHLDNHVAPRNWLCNGKLLQLTDSSHPKNVDIFKVYWQYGLPVLVSGVGKYLHMDLWHPNQISREYGDENSKNSLVNCMTGSIITNMKIRDFWDGFENISQRLLDENKKTMILKLKDWPPTQAFHEVMPDMFEDLMNALPLPEYTYIAGKCNLASRLPHFFVKPDLGPKMYNAYGWVTETDWRQGTTNLHLDISDAVNLMVYVGIPVDEPQEARNRLLQIVQEGEVDEVQMRRVFTDKPGALWHIFHQQDTDKIRNFIRKVCSERGDTLVAGHDPIHDQQMYLDKALRHRLKEEYNVEGYGILQCQGDGVFIPAGAPHQVFNIHSCVKIAEDFVSPEHVGHCFTLTNEFRYLSSTHSNHEDKLQIKNIIYHSIKDIVSSAIHRNCVG